MSTTPPPDVLSDFSSSLPADLFDTTTLVSLASTLVLLGIAYGASRAFLHPTTSASYRFLFIWHAFDALIHFFLEGSFLYHCFFSYFSVADLKVSQLETLYPTPANFLGFANRVYGAQAGGDDPFAQLWMVYANADKRWAGVDLVSGMCPAIGEVVADGDSSQTVVSLELLTVFGAGPLAIYICYLIAKRDPKVNFWLVVIATAEIYGSEPSFPLDLSPFTTADLPLLGWMTFCPEWLVGSPALVTDNWMYLWLYLVFFNGLWIVVPLWAMYFASGEISKAFAAQAAAKSK
jgi:hypothetical protein